KDGGITLDPPGSAQRYAGVEVSLAEAELVGQLDGDPLGHGSAIGIPRSRHPEREPIATRLNVGPPAHPGHREALVEEEAVPEVSLRGRIVVEGAVRKREEEKEAAAVVDLRDELVVPLRKV